MFEGKKVKVLLANAGSGKTTRLLDYAERELRSRRPEEIAFVTFTRRGVEEGLRRMCGRYVYTPDDFAYFKTFHALTFHALGAKYGQIFQAKHQREFNRMYGYEVNRIECDRNRNVHPTKDSQYLDYYDLERTNALSTRQIADNTLEADYYRAIVRRYERYKNDNGLLDFTDCLVRYMQEGETLPCSVVLVDEAQDLTMLQWRIVEKAGANAESVYIAGDTKQALYSYSGARPDVLIGLSKSHPIEHLAMSYRLPLKVYKLAEGITRFISNKEEQMSVPNAGAGEGSVSQVSDVARVCHLIRPPEKDGGNCQWYLLARNNCFLPRITGALEDALVPYWTADGFFMGGEIMRRLKDYIGFSRLNYKSEDKKRQFAEKFGITDFTEPFTSTNLFTEERKWVYAAYLERYGLEALKGMCAWNPQVYVGTIHSVKGGEAENVALLLDATRRTKANVFSDIDEELRCLYVGVTRAKKRLYLVDSREGDGYDNIIQAVKEQFCLNFD